MTVTGGGPIGGVRVFSAPSIAARLRAAKIFQGLFQWNFSFANIPARAPEVTAMFYRRRRFYPYRRRFRRYSRRF